jgi:hypothetical protein
MGAKVHYVTVSGNGSKLFAAGLERVPAGASDTAIIRWWDLATGRELGHARGGNFGGLAHLALSPDGQMLATGQGQWVTLWRLEPGPAKGQQDHRP